ncbi:MAG: Fe-S cluster assembly protein HesB [Solirubrobacteraceae bacterium]
MLTLTPIASEAIRQLASQTDGPDTSGIRISPGPETPEGPALELALVPEGEPTDQELDAEGAHVYLEPGVADVLDTMVLDADVDAGRVTFMVREPGLAPEDHPGPTPNGDSPA